MERSDKHQATASYVLNLYEYVEQLNHNFSQYSNNLLYLEHQKGAIVDLDKEKLFTEQELEQIHIQIANIRHYIMQSYLHIKTVLNSGKFVFTKKKDFDSCYDILKKKYVPNRDEIEKFVLLCNTFLMEEFMASILQTSNDVIKDIYND